MIKECRYIPRLETERLVLRKITAQDAGDLKKRLIRDDVEKNKEN